MSGIVTVNDTGSVVTVNVSEPVITVNEAGVVAAANVPFTPTGGISATNVQAAIAEVDAAKQPLDSDLTALASDYAGATKTLTYNVSKAATSAGLTLQNSSGAAVMLLGAGPSLGITAYGQINGTSLALSSLTSGRVTFATTSGLLTDSSALTFASGVLTIGDGTGAPFIRINGAAAQTRGVMMRSASANRWYYYTDATAESGSNAGSNFGISAYDDAGAFIDSPLSIVRAAGGAITLARPVTCTNTTASTSTSTGALVVSGDTNISRATGSAAITPATLRLESTTSASDFSTTTNWANLDFYSADTSGPGASVRARIGARMDNALGSAVDLVFEPSDSTGRIQGLRLYNNGSVSCGPQSALATSATGGFTYIRGGAGTPTGVPVAVTGQVPLYVDTTNNKLYFYSGGAWRDAGP